MSLLGSVGGYRYQATLWSLHATGRLMLHDLTPAEADRMAALMAQYAQSALRADYDSWSTYSIVSPLHPGHPILGMPP